MLYTGIMASFANNTVDVFMNVKQVSGYLHLNEKKIYEMVNLGIIPATKVTGKWMFPKELIDKWMLDSTHSGLLRDRLIIASGDDPLLSRILNDFSAELGHRAIVTSTNAGTRAGLDLLNTRRVDACGVHWGPAQESRTRHPSLLQQYSNSNDWVLIRAFQREQGLLYNADGNGRAVEIPGVFDREFRWGVHGSGSGSTRFLLEALSRNGLIIDDLNLSSEVHTDREAAAAINLKQCDVALGTRACANESGLDFLSLGWENFDFAIPRKVWFRHLFRHLIEKIQSETYQKIGEALGGYRFVESGKLVWGGE